MTNKAYKDIQQSTSISQKNVLIDIWKDPVGSKLIAGFIGFLCYSIYSSINQNSLFGWLNYTIPVWSAIVGFVLLLIIIRVQILRAAKPKSKKPTQAEINYRNEVDSFTSIVIGNVEYRWEIARSGGSVHPWNIVPYCTKHSGELPRLMKREYFDEMQCLKCDNRLPTEEINNFDSMGNRVTSIKEAHQRIFVEFDMHINKVNRKYGFK